MLHRIGDWLRGRCEAKRTSLLVESAVVVAGDPSGAASVCRLRLRPSRATSSRGDPSGLHRHPLHEPDRRGTHHLVVHDIGRGARLEDILRAFEKLGHYRW